MSIVLHTKQPRWKKLSSWDNTLSFMAIQMFSFKLTGTDTNYGL